MAKLLSTKEMYSLNTIGSKFVDSTRRYEAGTDHTGKLKYITKPIWRIKYLKICWNCGHPYESHKIASYGCSQKCSWHINYKLKNGINPPTRMEQLTKVKVIMPIKERFGYK